MEIKWINISKHSDERGSLLVAEAQKNIPFDIKRVYCLYGMHLEPRGFHAHKELQQVMICLSGHCDVILDDGSEKKTVSVDRNQKGLLIDKMIWHEMHNFSENCVLMVLASDWYDENDYFRNYLDFRALNNTLKII